MASRDDVNRLRVTIAGTEYTLRGDASVEQMRTVANKVDELMTEIAQANPQLDEKRAAVLTAVNIADELYRLQIQYDSLLQLLDEQTDSNK
ncbi:cell division protein ZapA [Alicyclobacillus sp. SO9]|uniref:cell division protein ZapA n=1 Tax=Alicyclobacillus sp. SO9 TaxID=2665646 RepID=UPI0018E7FEAE|nr:cell division protein ZapA [Alicyclobacillus sp. SO9]QQE77474.1 cell division protein ZapA [Alicyclobacillus sp. SO9]